MMEKVKRYYASLDHGTYAQPKYDCNDEIVKASDFDAALSRVGDLSKDNEILRGLINEGLAREAALREALSEIIVKVQESRSETRSLNWIEGRAQSALEGKPWVKGVFQMPDPKNGKPKEERLSRELAALREELAAMTVDRDFNLDGKQFHSDIADSLQQRLIAAEQRNAEFQEAALDVISNLGEFCCGLQSQSEVDYITEQLDKLAALFKPTESGASE